MRITKIEPEEVFDYQLQYFACLPKQNKPSMILVDDKDSHKYSYTYVVGDHPSSERDIKIEKWRKCRDRKWKENPHLRNNEASTAVHIAEYFKGTEYEGSADYIRKNI